MQLDIDNNEDKDNYDNNALSAINKYDEDPEGTCAPPDEEDAKSCKNCLLRGVVHMNDKYSLSEFVRLLDACAEALAMFKHIELQDLKFFEACLFVHARSYYKEHLLICTKCLRWNLTSPFSQCNCKG
jgi:hypothetical protein